MWKGNCLITLHLDEQLGWRGGEQQAFYLIRALAEAGYPVLAAGKPQSEFVNRLSSCPGVQVVQASFLTEWDFWSVCKLARVVKKHGVEIIHAHTSHTHSLACFTKLFCPGVKVLVTRRVDFAPNANFWTRWKYRRADRIVAISDCIRQVLEDFGVDSKRIKIIYSAQDPRRLDQTPTSLTELGMSAGSRVLLCPAALVGHKDHATLIWAMKDIVQQKPEVHLLLAGEGERRGAIEAQVSELGIAGNVHLLGYRKDVPALMKSADLLVLSSKMEGLGSTIIEAMFCGLPIVACASGGIPELVKNEETGLLVPAQDSHAFAQAVIRLLNDKEFANRLALQAKDFAQKNFHVDSMVSQYIALYEELLKTS